MATVFISHASADTDVALRVERWLTDAGHAVLLDRSVQSGIGLGDDWRLRIEAWLRAADAMVCLVTAAYVASQWGVYEIARRADTRAVPVLPLVVEPEVRHPQLADAAAHRSRRPRRRTGPGNRTRRRCGDSMTRAASAGPTADHRSPASRPSTATGEGCSAAAPPRWTAWLQRLVSEPERLLPVVGPSGCGKSSLVRAGLVPAMAARPELVGRSSRSRPRQDPVGWAGAG